MSLTISYSFTASEVLPLGTLLLAQASAPVDLRAARGGISARQGQQSFALPISLTDNDKTIQITTTGLKAGGYQLTISELLDKSGNRFPKLITVPFTLDTLSGKVPEGLRIENVAPVQIGETSTQKLLPGQTAEDGTEYVEFVKAADAKTFAPVELAFDKNGQRVDGNAKLDEMKKRHAAKFGRLHESLFERLQAKSDSDTVDVVVWPRLQAVHIAYDKPTDKPLEAPTAGEKEADQQIAKLRDQLVAVLQGLGVKIGESSTRIPGVYATVTVAQARKMNDLKEVGLVALDETDVQPDLRDSQIVSHANQAHILGWTGKGIKVGVFETGPAASEGTTGLSFAERYDSDPSASKPMGHAVLTNSIVKNLEDSAPHGFAQDCSLYSANSGNNKALQWALDKGCTVISQSFHRDSENNGATIQSDDMLKDWMVLHFPHPFISQAAGNIDNGQTVEYVNHKGFNSINAGNHNDDASAMATDSSSRNPSSLHGDRELPEICANGTSVTANGYSMSGTSFAAPAVAGSAACIQQANNLLKSWPEGVRAILQATAIRNVNGDTWAADINAKMDARDGAGALDVQEAGNVATALVPPNQAPARRGFYVGAFNSSLRPSPDFDPTTGFWKPGSFFIRPQNWFPDEQNMWVQVALCWTGVVAEDENTSVEHPPTSTALATDYDLFVYAAGTDTVVAMSTSYDNSYEIATFAAWPGQDYRIAIRRSSGSAAPGYFGVAWTSMIFPQ